MDIILSIRIKILPIGVYGKFSGHIREELFYLCMKVCKQLAKRIGQKSVALLGGDGA